MTDVNVPENEDKAQPMKPINMRSATYASLAQEYDVESNAARKQKLEDLLNFMDDSMQEIDDISQDLIEGNVGVRDELFASIRRFGNEPTIRMAKISDDMLNQQDKFSEQVRVFRTTINTMEDYMKVAKDFASGAGEVLKRVGATGGKVLKGFGKLIASITGTAKQMTDDEKYLEQMEKDLPEKRKLLERMPSEIDKTVAGIEAVISQSYELGNKRVETLDEIDIYIAATSEVMRRFDADYIPALQKKLEASGSSTDERALDIMLKAKSEFVIRIEGLTSQRLLTQTAAMNLTTMIDNMETQQRQLLSIRDNRVPAWKGILAEAGLGVSSLKAAIAIQKGQKLGDDMFEQLSDTIQKTTQMTLDASSGSVVQIEKLLEAAKRAQQALDERAKVEQKKLDEALSGIAKMDEMSKKLDGYKDQARQQKLLDAAEGAAAAEKKNPKPANDSVAPEADDKKAAARPRRGAGGPSAS